MKQIVIVQITFALLIMSGTVVAQLGNSKYNNSDTPKIRASFIVVPDTNDIKELRAFITHSQNNWWTHMSDRYKDDDDIEIFQQERFHAILIAAEKILVILTEQGRDENTNGENEKIWKNFNFAVKPEDNDTMFALKAQIASFTRLSFQIRTQESLDKYEKLVESLEQNPKRTDFGIYTRLDWIRENYYFSYSLPDDQQRLMFFNKTFDDMKKYLAANADNPLLKYHITSLFHTQICCAETIESLPGTSIKKGTLVVPALEYYDAIYRSWDEDFAKQDSHGRDWSAYYEREMAKYRILAADNPMMAFREAVEKFMGSLEKRLDESSIQNVREFEAIAEEMGNRNEAEQLLYKAIYPIFTAAHVPAIKDYAVVIDTRLHWLLLEGKELEFEAISLNGTKINLKDYRGKIVLLYYCNDETYFTGVPFLAGAYHNKTFQDKGFDIIMFCTDVDVDRLKNDVKEHKLAWTVASEVLSKQQHLADSRNKYNINSFPTFVLIDREGKVVRGVASDKIREMVTVLSKELFRL